MKIARLLFVINSVAVFILPMLAIIILNAPAERLFAIVAAFAACIYIYNGNLKNIWAESDVNKVIILLIAYSLISIIWTIKPDESLKLWILRVLFFIGALGLFSSAQSSGNYERQLILESLLAGIIAALILVNNELSYNFKNIALFWYNNIYFTNEGSCVISLLSWAPICYLWVTKRCKSALLLFFAVLATVLRMESLSSILGFSISGLVIFPIVYYKGKRALKVFAVIAAIGVMLVIMLASILNSQKLIGNVPIVPDAASDYRLYIWDYTAKHALQKHFFGWGFNASQNFSVEQHDSFLDGRPAIPNSPHNFILQVWLELGVFGLFIYTAFLIVTLQHIAKKYQNHTMMAFSCALFTNYFIIGLLTYSVWQDWLIPIGILSATFLLLATSFKKDHPQ